VKFVAQICPKGRSTTPQRNFKTLSYSFFIVALLNCDQKVAKGKHLISIIEAAKLLGDHKNISVWDNAKPLKMVSGQASAFIALVRMLRNNFEHFNTDHWSIEIIMVEGIFRKMIPVIRFITLESNTILFTEEQEFTIKGLISQLETLISIPNGSISAQV